MKQSRSSGLIGIIVIIILAIITLSYFNIDLKTVVEKPETQKNLTYAAEQSASLWNTHLKEPVTSVWKAITGVVWKTFVESMQQPAKPIETTTPATIPEIKQ